MLPKRNLKKMLKQIHEASSEMHTETEEINYVSDYLLSLNMQQK